MVKKTLTAAVVAVAAFASLVEKPESNTRRAVISPLVAADGTTVAQNRPEIDVLTLPPVRVGPSAAQQAAKEFRDRNVANWMKQYRAYGLDPELAGLILSKAEEHDIPPRIAFGLVRVESEFYPRAKSHVGARGLTQVMLGTARYHDPQIRPEDLYDPELNLDLGFKHLRYLLRYYDGNTRLALLGYNRGHGTVDRVLKQGGDPSNGYARKVMSE